MNEVIFTTPLIERCVELLKNCSSTKSIGAIVGGNGTGKTFALKALEGRYKALGLPGECFRYRCCQIESGATRGIRDLLIELGAGGAALMNGGATSVQLLAKIALRELSQRNIRCVLLDEADQWVTLTLAGLISLFDLCREKDYPVTLIVAGAQRPEQWLGALPAMRSRTLHVETSSNLDPTLMASVLKVWSEPLARLVAKNDVGEKAAAKVIARIHKGTNGNFRRLSYFAELSKQENDRAIDLAYVAEVLAKMKNQ
jgi:hypothetical protein